MPDPAPPFDYLPPRFRDVAYADLPPGLKQRVDNRPTPPGPLPGPPPDPPSSS